MNDAYQLLHGPSSFAAGYVTCALLGSRCPELPLLHVVVAGCQSPEAQKYLKYKYYVRVVVLDISNVL
jgi:hypothetical protein